MTPRQQWIEQQSAQFKAGYEAACRCERDDKTKNSEWRRGYCKAVEDIEYGG